VSDTKNRDGVTRNAVEFATWVVRYFDAEDEDSAYTVATKFDAAIRKARAEAFKQGAEALCFIDLAGSIDRESAVIECYEVLEALASKERA